MNFVFKIFGTPYIFDLYQGSEHDINYFQSFYNGSKENTKFTIHRMASGKVSYSYLRYNFKTSGGRDNSFFGMSIIFDKEYCNDVESLYHLFESAYVTILQNKILLEEVNDNLNIQAKYLIQKFADAESEVKRIENVICKNLLSQFVDDIHTIDSSFKQGNPNLLLRLNNKQGNPAFLKALREYSWISISPEYKENDTESLSQEAITELNETIAAAGKKIDTLFADAVGGSDIKRDVEGVSNQIKNGIDSIKPYLQLQLELHEQNDALFALKERVDTLIKAVYKSERENSTSATPPIEDLDTNNSGEKEIGDEEITETRNETIPFPCWKDIYGKHKKKIWSVAGIMFLAGLLWWLYPHSNAQYEGLLKAGDDLLQSVPFNLKNIDNAIVKYDSAVALNINNSKANSRIKHAKQTAIDTLKTVAEREFCKGGIGSTPKIDGYNEAVKQLQIISKKGYSDTDDYSNIIEEYKQGTIDYYFEEVDKDIPIENKKKYLEYILELDSTNEKAKNKLNNLNSSLSSHTTNNRSKTTNECYVKILGYSAKKTVDEFLKTIEDDLTTKRNVTSKELETLRSYCQMIIDNRVGCTVSENQKTTATNLKAKIPTTR
ncbi:hypothetical protein M2459_000238 [Parabacteroides sp. PF5-5]|uniref:hypothetical protein n=1 Tax=unclassified Parabacteroides TaxID=2649774 RepID=UPI002473FF2B|nr:MULTISPECIES: hypothetical protein [unclassified Parabacteroides]MDH6303906.1 hypothetical protein [Parabacteroides sp. PH5-39]MDH6314523.1 hypothetical protein [Parabacteroides sp. PF5-13]MDH6318412.1 hypothetical protein [Parabacteroides sp. PH5-13]MDH6322295.1 hypothetical protein [Parabacteroides sp. PH5-8]MDH6325625.1 hypothetical protein [Parabacteroides sp. PH5-41]